MVIHRTWQFEIDAFRVQWLTIDTGYKFENKKKFISSSKILELFQN